jgi:hypothetical protein
MAKEKQEYDYEGDMAMSQLKSIIANAQRIHDMLERDTNLPEWVQSKITLAEDYISTTANYMQGEMSEEWEVRRGTKVLSTHKKKDDADVKAMKHPLNKVYAKEEADKIHSVHVSTHGKDGEKQLNSPEFKKHLQAHQGEVHYMSDKGVAFKFKKDYHASAFHRGIQSHFKHLSSENDGPVNEDMAAGTGPVNVAANVADPQNKKLFAKPMKRFKQFKAN